MILFEMYNPYDTFAERAHLVSDALSGRIPPLFSSNFPSESTLVMWTLSKDPDLRPSMDILTTSEVFLNVVSPTKRPVLFSLSQSPGLSSSSPSLSLTDLSPTIPSIPVLPPPTTTSLAQKCTSPPLKSPTPVLTLPALPAFSSPSPPPSQSPSQGPAATPTTSLWCSCTCPCCGTVVTLSVPQPFSQPLITSASSAPSPSPPLLPDIQSMQQTIAQQQEEIHQLQQALLRLNKKHPKQNP
ncbi:hypothetical protein Pelo_842 [Pelomyxa schiedti]|nr:hypothetical protein Pelo_842 [Pelomyxa schiedti]